MWFLIFVFTADYPGSGIALCCSFYAYLKHPSERPMLGCVVVRIQRRVVGLSADSYGFV